MILGMLPAVRRVLVPVVTIGAVFIPAMPAQATPDPTPVFRGDIRPQLPPPVRPQLPKLTRPQVPPPPSTLASYTLLAPPSMPIPSWWRAGSENPGVSCPVLATVKKVGAQTITKNYPMTERTVGPKARPAFTTVKVCSAAIPAGITSASVGRTIPATLPATVTRIGIFADSGCRVEAGRIQDCAKAWPLAPIANRLAALKPQVVLNPGDYYYRESACPAANLAQCGVNPPVAPIAGCHSMTAAHGWMTDAINPMSALFPVAPIAFLRGNHEACNRAGNGFFLFFDPRPTTAAPASRSQSARTRSRPPRR